MRAFFFTLVWKRKWVMCPQSNLCNKCNNGFQFHLVVSLVWVHYIAIVRCSCFSPLQIWLFEHETNFCIKHNWMLSHLRTHTVWILLYFHTGQTEGQRRFRFTATRRRKAFQTMAFLFRGIFQPLRSPSDSEMPKASSWQPLTSFQIVLVSQIWTDVE